MKTSEFLELARSIICTPETWCQGKLAKRGKGRGTNKVYGPIWNEAVQFCALGALAVVEQQTQPPSWRQDAATFLDDVAHELFPGAMSIEEKDGLDWMPAIAKVNDRLGHEAVMKVYAEAIRRAKEEEHAAH